jgi:hypothetical protein
VPPKLRTDKNRHGPMTLQDFNTLGVDGPDEYVSVYGSLEAAHERYRHLRDSGQLHPGSEAFWYFDGPEYLRTFDAWLETAGLSPPTTREGQIDLHTAFANAREKWLEETK